jgi:transposase
MIVIGVDTHKRNHTLVAVDGQTGALAGQRAIVANDAGSLDALRFAAGLAEERVWAIEDCRHVSARLEAALIAAGERVLRVPAAMTGQARRVSRQAGKSDAIDARAVALAVVRDGIESFPVAFTDVHAMEIRVLSDYRDQLISERTRMINRLRWHLVTIAPDFEAQLGQAALKGPRICARLARQLARQPQSPRLRVAKQLLKRISEIGREERELLDELSHLVDAHAPQLQQQPGCGTVTAAIIIGHTAGAQRFPDGTSPGTPAPLRSPPPAATPNATDCTAAGTASSTARSTSSRSRAPGPTPKPAPTWSANTPRARPSEKPSAPQTPPRPPYLAAALCRSDAGRPARVDQWHKHGNTDFHLTQEQPLRHCRLLAAYVGLHRHGLAEGGVGSGRLARKALAVRIRPHPGEEKPRLSGAFLTSG